MVMARRRAAEAPEPSRRPRPGRKRVPYLNGPRCRFVRQPLKRQLARASEAKRSCAAVVVRRTRSQKLRGSFCGSLLARALLVRTPPSERREGLAASEGSSSSSKAQPRGGESGGAQDGDGAGTKGPAGGRAPRTPVASAGLGARLQPRAEPYSRQRLTVDSAAPSPPVVGCANWSALGGLGALRVPFGYCYAAGNL
eukprot:scaffold1808_cov360-Prasinococcus_capsulatus_cf.AAC.19